jgi:hypothetical protein
MAVERAAAAIRATANGSSPPGNERKIFYYQNKKKLAKLVTATFPRR